MIMAAAVNGCCYRGSNCRDISTVRRQIVGLCCACRYDAEAPERAPVPAYEERLSKFERMCIVKVCAPARRLFSGPCRGLCRSSSLHRRLGICRLWALLLSAVLAAQQRGLSCVWHAAPWALPRMLCA